MSPNPSGRASPSEQRDTEPAHHVPSFTAVNGVNGRASPKVNGVQQNSVQSITTPKDDPYGPNGKISQISSSESVRSSPSLTESGLHDASSSPESTKSPPIRKRSYPEAFGDSERRDYPPRIAPAHRQGEFRRDDREASSDPENSKPGSSEFDPHAPLGQTYFPSRSQAMGDTEQRLAAEALRRESESSNLRRDPPPALANGDDPQRQQFGEYDRSSSGVQVDADRKRRKRVFSNRTKTGCMTCRKRKKKCDEMHPECNNCLRGGFVCEGYTVRNTWQKPSSNKQPVPLQSKDGAIYHGTPGQPGIHHQPPPPHQGHPQPTVAPRYPDEYGTRPEYKGPMDDGRRMSPHNEGRPPQGWPNPPPPSYAGPPQPPPPGPYGERPIEQRPPIAKHDNPHEVPENAPPYPMTSAHIPPQPPGPPLPQHPTPQHQHQPHHPPPPLHAAHPHQQQQPMPPPMPPASTSPGQKRPQSHHRPETERDRMLRGEYFLPYTPALTADREQCSLAVWRFNNSTNPSTGIPPEDRMRFFRNIVTLRPTTDSSGQSVPHDPSTDPPIVGGLGNGVIVEAPFHCDYGYNITIGDNVVIGADCRITDTCSVHIGNNVVFSPGVKLVCATYAIDPRERRKGKGRALGRQIVIEDDAWIGSNVTILPGVKVGRCTTVGAGSLLHKDVPPYTVIAGNPPKVVRGIYDDGRAM